MPETEFADVNWIRQVVDTFPDLSPRIREKVVMLARHRINSLVILNMNQQYEEIAEIIYRLTDNYYESKLALRLDSLFGKTNRPLHEIVGGASLEDGREIQKEVERRDEVHISRIIDVLEGKIDRQYLDVLYQLVEATGKGDFLLKVTPREVSRNAEQIRARLEFLVKQYGRDGMLLFPQREIKRINLDTSIEIIFKRRDWKNQSPLEFLKKYDVYKGLSRGQLQRFDEGLYSSMARRDELKAIPLASRYTGDPLLFFKNHLELYGQVKSQVELKRLDPKLHHALANHNQLREIFPSKTYRGFPSPLDYFYAHPELHGLGRFGIHEADRGLYDALRRWDQLQQIPRKRIPYRGFSSPLDYFNAHSEMHGLTKTQFANQYPNEYRALIRWKQLELAIPKTYRGFSSPLDYFNTHEELWDLTRKQLSIVDSGLSSSLRKNSQMNQAIPEKVRRTYRGYQDPLDYCKAHSEFLGLTAREFNKRDSGLYASLRRRKQLERAKQLEFILQKREPTEQNLPVAIGV